MSAKRVEETHTELIKKLLIDAGLVCDRSPHYSEESEEEEEEIQPEIEPEAGALEEHFEIEHYQIPEEMAPEEDTNIFPTPSLRRVIPERLRRIEAQNRIKVLPDQFNTNIDAEAIPRILYTPPQVYISKLAEITGCKRFKSSLAEYWFLDTLANLLRRAQEDNIDKPTQAILVNWFCEWMREMQHFDAATRDRMMRRWRDNMIAAAKVITEEEYFPKPDDAGVYYKAKVISDVAEVSKTDRKSITRAEVEVGEFVYACAMEDLSKLIHYIYDLIRTDFQYNLIRSVFTFSPGYELIEGPYQLQLPKRGYALLKPKKEVKAPKGKPPDKASRKKMEPDTEEYIALKQFIDKSRKLQDQQDEMDREDWNKRNTILPLNFAVTPDFLDIYWPPPPEPAAGAIVADVAVIDPKAKKGKK